MSIGMISIIPALVSSIATIVDSKMELPLGDSPIEDVNLEIKRQDISLELAKQQARVAQELAIALRIETADEVEIEEFYDDSGEGNAGLKITKDNLNLGVSGSRTRITKRIYKFKGHNGEKMEVYQQKLNEILSPKAQSDNE